MLQQLIYQTTQMQRPSEQRVYATKDLESLSANALYTGLPSNGGFSSSFGSGIGSSNYHTWLPEDSPSPSFQIRTPSSYHMGDVQGAVPSSYNSFSYLNSRGQELGGIGNLNSSEMKLLLNKHFGGADE